MPVKKIITLADFGASYPSGLNTVKHPRFLSDGEFSVLNNAFLFNGRIRQRPPVTVWPVDNGAGTLLTTTIQGLQAITRATGAWSLVGLGATKLAKVVLGGVSVVMTDAMSLAFATSVSLWRSVQYKNYGYAVRPDLNYILRFDDTNYWKNGIAPPSTAAVLAQGAVAGSDAGNFQGVFTFVDVNGVESDYSPLSNTVAIAINRSVDWSSVDVSTNPRVVARNLYRTLPDQKGEYFFVGTIPNNTVTTFNEDLTVDEMGDLAPVGHAVQPAVNYVDIATQFERLWATDGSYVYGSLAEDPDSFPAENIFAFSPDDGQPIKALKAHGSDLLVFKTGSVWSLNQSLGAFEFLPRLIDERNGCIATHSACVADGLAFWYSGKAVFMSDGRSPGVDISSGHVAEIAAVTASKQTGAVGVTFSKYGWYCITFPENGTNPETVYIYDYRRKFWFTWSLVKYVYGPAGMAVATGTPVLMREIIDSNGVGQVYANFAQNKSVLPPFVFDLFSAGLNAVTGDIGGTANFSFKTNPLEVPNPKIPVTIKLRGIDFGAPGLQHSISRILLACESPVVSGDTTTVTLSAYLDGTLYRTRVVSAVGARMWRNLGFSTRARKTDLTEISIIRSGLADLDIRGVQIHGDLWGWLAKEGL